MNREVKIAILAVSIVTLFIVSVYGTYYYSYLEGYSLGYKNGQDNGYGSGYVQVLSEKLVSDILFEPNYYPVNFTLNLSQAPEINGFYSGSLNYWVSFFGYHSSNSASFPLNNSSTGTVRLEIVAGSYEASSPIFNLDSSVAQGVLSFSIPSIDLQNSTGYVLFDIHACNVMPLDVYYQAPLLIKIYD